MLCKHLRLEMLFAFRWGDHNFNHPTVRQVENTLAYHAKPGLMQLMLGHIWANCFPNDVEQNTEEGSKRFLDHLLTST